MNGYRLLIALVFCTVAGLIGQTGRDAYRQAYDVWQQALANLERDAGAGGTAQVAQAALNKTKAEFEAKSLHQKVEVGLPEILSTRDNAFYTSAEVQLIRVGAYQGAPITEVLHYRVKFKFLVNPDLTRNGRFPTAVAAFQLEPIKT